MALFAGHGGAYGTHGTPYQESGSVKWEIKKVASTRRGPTTAKMWVSHLRGEVPLGVIPIREDGSCVWGSIDVDQYDVDLLGIVQRAERSKFPLVAARSKSAGLHLFLFLAEPQSAGALQSVLRDMAARLGLAECEIFPKQTVVLSDRGDVGNWMVMPYFGGTYGGRIREQVGIKRTGAEQTVAEFLDHAEGMRLSGEDFEALGRRRTARAPEPRGNGAATPEPKEAFGDGPPCLQHLAGEGIHEHEGRNNALFMMGLYHKRASPASWQRKVEDSNQRFMVPPMTSEEVTGTIRSLAKKDYEYLCKAQPMCSHCDAGLCRTRRHGVGVGGQYPVISSLSKLDTDPPLWFLDVGDLRYEASTEQLLDYNRMLVLFAARGTRVYRAMKRDAWLAALAEPMENAVVLEAPPDAGRGGQFHEVLEDLLVHRWRGEHREDLLRGKPWEDQEAGRHYFRLRDLQTLLVREGVRDMTRGQLATRIREHGGDSHTLTIKKKDVFVWFVPTSAVTQDPEVPAPKPKGEPI